MLDFQVKASGYYDVDLLMAQRLESGWIQAFIDGVVLKGFGTLSTDAEPVLKAEPEKLGAVYLDAGVHTLKLELQQRYYVIPAKLTLTQAELPADALTLSAGALEEFTEGQDASTEITALIGKFSALLDHAELDVQTSDSAIATASVAVDEQKRAILSVHGVSKGEATITVTAKLFGATAQVQVPVQVASALKEQIYDFTACVAQGHETGIDHVTLEDHGWALNAEGAGAYASIGLAEAGLVEEQLVGDGRKPV